MSTACPAADRLVEFAAGDASEEAARAIETHIDECDACRSALSAIASGTGTSSSGGAPAPTFGRYRLDGVLGAGGMGIVYAGFDPQLKRAVAIKVVRRAEDDAGRARLVREAQSLARLSHRHVCQVYDVGSEGDEVWVAMEKIDGVTLREWARQPLRAGELLGVLAAAAEGLAAAHAAGIVHRDVKPENVLVARDGRAVVSDFGLARVEVVTDAVGGDSTTSTLGGTPAYLAPEQMTGQAIDARVDQFAFAVMAWELLTGARPFPSGADLATVRAGVVGATPSLSRPIAAALRRALAAAPADRFASMTELIAAIQPPRPWYRRRRTIAIAAIAAAVIAGGAVWLGVRGDDPAAACARGARKVDAIWNPTRAAAMRAAFVGTGASFAADTADRVTAIFDGFSARYTADTIAACDATFHGGAGSPRALDAQRACLDHGLDGVDQLLGLFAHTDRPMLELAINAAFAVTDLDPCRDTTQLLARQDEPADPRVRATIASLRAKLARAEALDDVGNHKDSLAAATDVAADADTIAYFPLRAEAAYRIGLEHRELDTTPAAEDALQRAVTAAEAGRDDLLAAYAWVRLLSAARARADYGEAGKRSEQAKAKLERLGNPPDAVAFWLVNRARLAQARGDLAAARADSERALALYEPLGVDRPRIVSTLVDLAHLYNELGLHELQVHTAERAAAIAEKIRGADHPLTAQALGELAAAQGHAGAHAQAKATYERALAINTRVYGADAVVTSASLNGIAGELVALGDPAGAQVELEAALAIRVKQLGADHPSTVSVEINLAMVLVSSHPRDAITHLEHVLAVRQKTAPDSAEVGLVYDHLAAAQRALGDHDTARISYQHALAIFVAKLGPNHPKVAMVLGELGAMDVATAPAAAIDPLEKAVAIDDRGERSPDDAAEDRFALAKALWDANRDRPRARAAAITAHDAIAHVDGAAPLRAELEAWLAAHRLE